MGEEKEGVRKNREDRLNEEEEAKGERRDQRLNEYDQSSAEDWKKQTMEATVIMES